jgi:hypothetical protein
MVGLANGWANNRELAERESLKRSGDGEDVDTQFFREGEGATPGN